MSNPDTTFFLSIDNIKYEYFNKKKYIYDDNQLHVTINISINGKQIGNGEISLFYNHNNYDNDSLKNYITCHNVKENDKNKILYISWMKNINGKNTGIYLFKLICHIAKQKNKNLIILEPTGSEGCTVNNDSCEYNTNTNNKLNSYNILDMENPYNTIDNTYPLLNCKLNRLYLNYGFTISNKICHPYGPSINQCFMICGIDRLCKIINLYLLMHFKPNTKDSLKILLERKQIENEINLRMGKRISTLFNTSNLNRNTNTKSKKKHNKSKKKLAVSNHNTNNNENISRLFNFNEVNPKVDDKFNINTTTNKRILFKYTNTINNNIQKKLSNVYTTNKNNLSSPRVLSAATIHLTGSVEGNELIEKLKKVDKSKISHLNFDKFAYLGIIRNLNDKNIKNSKKTGTYLNKTTKNTNFPTLDLGKVNPETNNYFIKKGSGALLINEIIKKLKAIGIKTVFLHAANPNLIPYYKKFGFDVFNAQVFMIEPSEYYPAVYYGEQGSGPLMYMNL